MATKRLTYTLEEVAEMTGFALRTLERDCRADPPRLEHICRHGKRYMTDAQIDAMLRNHTVTADGGTTSEDDAERERIVARLTTEQSRRVA